MVQGKGPLDPTKARVNQLVNRPEGPNFTQGATSTGRAENPAQEVLANIRESFGKFSASVQRTLVPAIFRSKTGIGLDPEIASLLNGSMKAAALFFITNPKTTVEGAVTLMQLMVHVEGFMDMGKGIKNG